MPRKSLSSSKQKHNNQFNIIRRSFTLLSLGFWKTVHNLLCEILFYNME